MKFKPTLHKLSNGITVILDPMDIKTASMKIHVRGGARIERPEESGISHFLEHTLFDGTKKYPTKEILNETLMDKGGNLKAITNTRCTEYYGRILSENFNVLLDVLSDMILNPLISDATINQERNVVIQEMKMQEDKSEIIFNKLVYSNVFSDAGLGILKVLGSVETLSSFNADILQKYKDENYTANNIIIGISGKYDDKEKVLKKLESLFGILPNKKAREYSSGTITPSVIYDTNNNKNQTEILMLFKSLYPDIRQYYVENMCVDIFKRVLRKRLCEDVRNKRGLVYKFQNASYGNQYTGVNGFYTLLSPEKLSELIAATAAGCYDFMYKNPITSQELKRYNINQKLSLANFYESSSNRLDRLIVFCSNHDSLYNPLEFDDMCEKITTDDVMKNSSGYFSSPISIIASGPDCDIDMKKIWDDNFKSKDG